MQSLQWLYFLQELDLKNFQAIFPWRKRTAKSDVPYGISQDFEWILCYAKTTNFKCSIDGKEDFNYNSVQISTVFYFEDNKSRQMYHNRNLTEYYFLL